jgi:RNA polymerase sigma factor (TIGR02999 family)
MVPRPAAVSLTRLVARDGLEACQEVGPGNTLWVTMSEGPRLPKTTHGGEPKAPEEWLPLVYEELRRLAHHKMSLLPPGQTLQTTALVHEAWLRLAGDRHPQSWDNRGHFFSAAAEAMRRILVEQARSKAARRHGGGMGRVDLDQVDLAEETNSDVLLLVDEALGRLAEVDSQAAELVKLRFFVGLPNAQAAEVLGMAERTAKRNWAYARAWLLRELKQEIRGE